MKKKIYLSVVIPCYNEKENLERGVLAAVENYLAKQEYSSEVIISDDGSIDSSLNFVSKFTKKHHRFRLLKNHHAGKPFAVRSGINQAKGKWVLFMDMDQSAPLKEIEKFLPFFDMIDSLPCNLEILFVQFNSSKLELLKHSSLTCCS